MIHVVRSRLLSTNPDAGRTRTLIGTWYVDWSGILPTLAEVLEFLTPTQASLDDLIKIAAKAVYAGNTDVGRAERAIVALAIDQINVLRREVVGGANLTYDPPSLANGAVATSPSVTIAGTVFGDIVEVGEPYDTQGIRVMPRITAPNTVVIRLENGTGGTINLASGVWKIGVRRYTVMADIAYDDAKVAFENRINVNV